MASIQKRGKKLRIRWYDLAGRHRSVTVSDYATAKRVQRSIEHDLDNGRDWSPPRSGGIPDLEVMLADVIRGRALDSSHGYVCNLTIAGGQLLTMLAGRLGRQGRASDLKHQTLVDLYTWLVQPHPTDHNPRTKEQHLATCNPRTAAGRVNMVRSLWADMHAHEEHGQHVPPAPQKIRGLPSPEAPLLPAPSWEEMDATITAHVDQLPNWYQEQLLTLARFTGLRRSQLMALRWDWLDLDGATLWVHPSIGKTKQERRGRRIPLSSYLVERLSGWGRREGFVIDTGTSGRTIRRQSVYRCWEASGARREVWAPTTETRGQPMHAYRHGLATGLLLAGAPEYLVSRLHGHQASSVTVARYADADTLLLPRLRDVVAMIPEIGESTDERSVRKVDFGGGRR